jgi:rRNA maturation endonuclease Nob1
MAMKCRNCGSENPDGKKFCGDCGKELEVTPVAAEGTPERKCSACGRTLEMETNVCPFCGHWVKRSMFG